MVHHVLCNKKYEISSYWCLKIYNIIQFICVLDNKNVDDDIYHESQRKLSDKQTSSSLQLLAAEWHCLLRGCGGIYSSDPVVQHLCVHRGPDPDKTDEGQ